MTTHGDNDHDLFRTRSVDVAVLLRYALGADRHIETINESDGRMLFVFSGLNECRVLKNDYYGEASVTIGNLRAFNLARLELIRLIRAIRGRWYQNSSGAGELSEEVTDGQL